MTIYCFVFPCRISIKNNQLIFTNLQPPADQIADAGKGDGGADGAKPNYIAFVLVPVFFLLGLLGVVICHVLKRKGYRCTTEPQDGEEDKCEEEEKDPELGDGKESVFTCI